MTLRTAAWLALLPLVTIAACDLGGRDTGLADAGPDAGADTATRTGVELGWQWDDAGAAWEDGSVDPTACGDDCQYSYNMYMNEFEDSRGQSFFEIIPNGDGSVTARAGESVVFILTFDNATGGWWPQRHRANQSYRLRAGTHELISGQAEVFSQFGDVVRRSDYAFAWNDDTGRLTYTVSRAGRVWSGSAVSPKSPLVMFGLRETPLPTRGCHSPLFAFLVRERYDTAAGGEQTVPVFSPETEQLVELRISAGAQPGDLVVHYPSDTAKPPWHSQYNEGEVYETNDVTFSYIEGIPAAMGTRDHFHWEGYSRPPFEFNLALVGETEAVTPFEPGAQATEPFTLTGTPAIDGELTLPEGAGPFPLAVLTPGWDLKSRRGEIGALRLYDQIAARLAAEGFVVARYDSRPEGDGSHGLARASVSELAADLEAVLNHLRGDGRVLSTDVSVIAVGAGAHVAAKAIRARPSWYDRLVLIAPLGGDFAAEHIATQKRFHALAGLPESYLLQLEGELTGLFDSFEDQTFDGELWNGHDVFGWQTLLASRVVDAAADLPPTLVLGGDADVLADPAAFTALAAALDAAGVDVTSRILPGLSHGLTATGDDPLWPEHGGYELVDETALLALTAWLTGGTK